MSIKQMVVAPVKVSRRQLIRELGGQEEETAESLGG